jgi:bifunctional DNase/RNase
MDYIQVEIIGLSTSPSSGGAYALVLGEVDGNRRLPIIIGAFEAQAIALELEKIEPPRPMTHDLLREMADQLGAHIDEVMIDELRDGTFYAKIRCERAGNTFLLDARPSDAVALAVRASCPIMVSPQVLQEAGIVSEQEEKAAQEAEDDDQPVAFEEEEPSRPMSHIDQIEADLAKAIEEENYEVAARLRDEIQRLRGENG